MHKTSKQNLKLATFSLGDMIVQIIPSPINSEGIIKTISRRGIISEIFKTSLRIKWIIDNTDGAPNDISEQLILNTSMRSMIMHGVYTHYPVKS